MRDKLNVVVFSGGRGADVLVRSLAVNPRVRLTLAINGYDDGASTGEVRRFLGDALGPSDFRKNASRLAAAVGTADPALLATLDARLPDRAGAPELDRIVRDAPRAVAERLERFDAERRASGRPFDFADCAVGNLVFAGGYLALGRDFNRTLDDYCALLGLPPGLIENVTDGADAHLVAIDVEGRVLASEEAIVDPRGSGRIRDIYLIARRLDDAEVAALDRAGPAEAAAWFEARRAPLRLNPRLEPRLASADLIVYAPGTQHSSLFPSYLTPGLSAAVARNLKAIKLLVTNILPDAEIAGQSATDLIERAVYYLKEKGRLTIPTPCVITHYLMNEPGHLESAPHVPLGPLETIEDPRLVRIANYEDKVSGRHDAERVLTPFIEALASRDARRSVAVWLYDADNGDKLVQTLLEMVRGGAADLPVALTALHTGAFRLEAEFAASLPFAVAPLDSTGGRADEQRALAARLRDGGFDYALLFESSGLYRGDDIVGLAAYLAHGRLDAVWGSRRLSVRDIQDSYRLRYRRRGLIGAVSFVGSHVLSLAYLLFHGRYIFDTLSGVRAVRAAYVVELPVPIDDPRANHELLVRLLRRRAELLEVPVRYLPLVPERAPRISVLDGLRALAFIAWKWLRRPARQEAA